MVKGKLVVLRHGQTEYNKAHLMTGQRDPDLTEKGERQADDAGKSMSGIVFDRAYGSTLRRAFNTAARALKASGCNDHLDNRVIKDARIMEYDTGDFTGRDHKTDAEIRGFNRFFTKPFPNGESEKQVVERVRAFYESEIAPRLLKGENILVVCHAGVVRAFDYVLGTEPMPADNDPPKFRTIHNALPTVFEYEDGKLARFYPLSPPGNKKENKIAP